MGIGYCKRQKSVGTMELRKLFMNDSILNPNTPLDLSFLVYMFLVGVFPGFYLSFLFFIKSKLHPFLASALSFIIGLIFGVISFIIIWGLEGSFHDHILYDWFLNNLFYIILLEILLILIHFFFFRKPKTKAKRK
jgi:hypothetical protein